MKHIDWGLGFIVNSNQYGPQTVPYSFGLHASPDTFGRCQTCGQVITFERLDALPHARLCISCKEKEEDEKRR